MIFLFIIQLSINEAFKANRKSNKALKSTKIKNINNTGETSQLPVGPAVWTSVSYHQHFHSRGRAEFLQHLCKVSILFVKK